MYYNKNFFMSNIKNHVLMILLTQYINVKGYEKIINCNTFFFYVNSHKVLLIIIY